MHEYFPKRFTKVTYIS